MGDAMGPTHPPSAINRPLPATCDQYAINVLCLDENHAMTAHPSPSMLHSPSPSICYQYAPICYQYAINDMMRPSVPLIGFSFALLRMALSNLADRGLAELALALLCS